MAGFGPDHACSSFAGFFIDSALFARQEAFVDVRFDSLMVPRVTQATFIDEHLSSLVRNSADIL